ncbi:hypothetical protein HX109_03610 [Galbibacter sp. BG1]|uniref:hypothetical protein n=1 Tax=Galbibacter sp. BG1 TaxID=1170699 RepID=UPI0015BD2D86|nr:hypothetical protein [Galbibacter sp. BG1]QLE00692.1 hypothetical protein HX109_03610 [Galbibacter sp. BG1]
MKFFNKSTNAVILGGIFFLIPLLLIILLITHALQLLLPIGRKIVELLHIHSLFGAATVTIVTILIIVLVCYLSGFLVQKGLVNDWGQKVEDKLFLFFPSLQILKYRLLGDKLSQNNDSDNWKAILLKEDVYYRIAFIISEEKDVLNIFIPDAPRMDAGEIRHFKMKDCEYVTISMKDAMNSLNSFGRDGQMGKYIGKTAVAEQSTKNSI